MNLKPGFTFQFADKEIDNHLWVLISKVPAEDGRVMVVNFSTWNETSDNSCILEMGDHTFIQHKTCVMYEYARLYALEALERAVDNHDLVAFDPIDQDLLFRVWDGAFATRRMPLKCKQFLEDQGLI